jgi:hypothetical protein
MDPEPPGTPCDLCGDVTPGAARYDDADRGWDALCLACWQLQQPPEQAPERARRPWLTGLGHARP